MRARVALLLITVTACGAGTSRSPGPAGTPSGDGVREIPLAVTPVDAGAGLADGASDDPPPLAGHLADLSYPPVYDGQRPVPSYATLRAVNAHEAWLALSSRGGAPLDVIVDLDKGCVTETFEPDGPNDVAQRLAFSTAAEVPLALGKEPLRSQLGAHLARLARFEQHEVAAVMVQGHADGITALSADHRKIALVANRHLFVSVDGGRHFAQAEQREGEYSDLRFSPDDRYLSAEATVEAPDHSRVSAVAIIDTTQALPQAPVLVPLENHTALRVTTESGARLFAHLTERCFYAVDPAAPALRKVTCVPGPKTRSDQFFFQSLSPSGRFGMDLQGDFQATRGWVYPLSDPTRRKALGGRYELHNAHVGPDDAGRFAWENSRGILRIDGGPEGVHDQKLTGMPLGFDLSGNVLLFDTPPLPKPPRPGSAKPLPRGAALDAQRCTLLRKAPSH